MVYPPLTENVVLTTITPLLSFVLFPDGEADWGLITNNNWIIVENAFEEQTTAIQAVNTSLESSVAQIEGNFILLQTNVENEAIARAQEDADIHVRIDDLQTQVDGISIVGAATYRQTGVALISGVSTTVTHNLGRLPTAAIISESSGTDVSSHYDTVITHLDTDSVDVTVGISGSYTVVLVG